jgi:hypothetical protein
MWMITSCGLHHKIGKKSLMTITSKVLKNLLEKLLNEKEKGLILHIIMYPEIIQECA